MKKLLRIVVPILLAALVVASIGWYLFVFDREFTRDILLQQARYNDQYGNSRISAWFYNMAYAHSGNDQAVAIELANQYKADKNFTKAEVTLSRAIHAEPSAELYTALCKTYVQQDKLMDAVSLLADIPDEAIRAELEARRPSAPVADKESGFYSQYIKVGLSSSSGTILYTTTGEYPSITNPPYSEPITMPSGETIVYCISVDETGLVSPVSIMSYTIGGVIEPAVFTDSAMEAAIRNALGVDADKKLYTNQLWEIKDFTVPGDAKDLSDLTLLPYLESLKIENLRMDSLSALSSLNKLQTLEMKGSHFPTADLSIIAKLPELTKLVMNDCSISTLSGIESATKLQYLDMSFNTIRNLEPLTSLSNLTELYMQHNALVELDSLSALTRLEKLDISYNSIISLQPISTCVKLSWLNAANNQLLNTNGIAALPLLKSLSLNYNSISDVSELGACLQIVELSISNNHISDISRLGGLSNMEIFDVSYNSIYSLPQWSEDCALRVIDCSYNALSNIDGLKVMKNLTYVSADYNQITNVDSLANCPNLVQINVYGNAIADVSALTEHNIIVNYDPTAQQG